MENFLDSVEDGDVEKVKNLLGNAEQEDLDTAIYWAAEAGHTKIVELLLKDPRVDPSVEDNEAFVTAVREGHTKIVELLLKDPRVDPSARNNEAIKSANSEGYEEIIGLLLQDPRVDPSVLEEHLEN